MGRFRGNSIRYECSMHANHALLPCCVTEGSQVRQALMCCRMSSTYNRITNLEILACVADRFQMVKTNAGMQPRYLRRWYTPCGKLLYSRLQVAKFLGLHNRACPCCAMANRGPCKMEVAQGAACTTPHCFTAPVPVKSSINTVQAIAQTGPATRAQCPSATAAHPPAEQHPRATLSQCPSASAAQPPLEKFPSSSLTQCPEATAPQSPPEQSPPATLVQCPSTTVTRHLREQHPATTLEQDAQATEEQDPQATVAQRSRATAPQQPPPPNTQHTLNNTKENPADNSDIDLTVCETQDSPQPLPSATTCILSPPQNGPAQIDADKMAGLEQERDRLQKEGSSNLTIYLLPSDSSLLQLPDEPNCVLVIHESCRLSNNRFAALVERKRVK